MVTTRRLTAIAGAAVLILAGSAATTPRAAESPQTQTGQTPQPTFRGSIELQQLDVSVVDADGLPIHGLTATDFSLTIDGIAQRVEVAAEVNVPETRGGAQWTREVASDVRSNLAGDGRVIVLVLDDCAGAPIGEGKAWTAAVKHIGHEIIDALGPSDQMAVLFMWSNKHDAQDFTNDHARLGAAVDRFRPVGAAARGMLLHIMQNLRGLEARRKALVFVSPSMPMHATRLNDGGFAPAGSGMGSGMRGGSGEAALANTDIDAASTETLRAGITFYGINPRIAMTPNAPSSGRLDVTAAPRSIAADTGGFQVGRPGDLDRGVQQILTETGTYYLIGYRPAALSTKTSFHPLDVRVARPGAVAHTRDGYIDPRAKDAASAPTLAGAMAGALPKSGLPLRVAALPFSSPHGDPTVAVIVGLRAENDRDRGSDHVDLQVRAFTAHGDQKRVNSETVDVGRPPINARGGAVELVSLLRLPPGRYELRCSATSEELGASGSVYTDLDVPEFNKAPVSLSGVALGLDPPPRAAPSDALGDLLPFVPTTVRAFRSTDRVRALVRVSAAKARAPVDVRWRLTDTDDHVVLDRADAIAPDRLDQGRAADVSLDLPLLAIPAGPYLLKLDATTTGGQASRTVRFSVVR